MTALEEQLTRALRRLSAQYETEQRRHSGQVEALQERIKVLERHVERLNGQSTSLAQDYRTLAGTLRGHWR
ncbi:MAG: hypothetical protein OXI46_08525 [Gemmatimonadota bacterium]|nr:hypothetical protein [Gemmatimonadota bacterium]